MSIISHPGGTAAIRGRSASRSRRLARLRCTAFPTDRPAAIPKREVSSPLSRAINTTSGWANDLPERLTRLKSAELVSRNLRFTWLSSVAPTGRPAAICLRRSGLSNSRSFRTGSATVPVCVLDVVVARDRKAQPAFRPAALQHPAAIGCGHAGAETMHANPAADFRLVSSLRHLRNSCSLIKIDEDLSAAPGGLRVCGCSGVPTALVRFPGKAQGSQFSPV